MNWIIAGLLCIAFQPVRLFRGHQQYHRGGSDQHERHASAGGFRLALRPSSTRLQSHQVSLLLLVLGFPMFSPTLELGIISQRFVIH